MKTIFTAIALFAISLISAQKSDAQVSKLFQNYLSIKNALAADDSPRASKAANDFLKTASAVDFKLISEGNQTALKKDAEKISVAKDIKTQRSYFYNLSANMIKLSEKFKLAQNPLYIQTCPMAKGDWISTEKNISNPYYGSEMLTCGSVKSEIK